LTAAEVSRETRWRAPRPFREGALLLVVDLDAELLAHLLDIDVHRGDDLLVRMGLAIDDDAVLQLLGAIDLHLAEVREAVVPAAVPDGHEVGVFLPGAGQLRAGQLLNVEIAVGVGIGRQVDRIGLRRAEHGERSRARNEYRLFHSFSFQTVLVFRSRNLDTTTRDFPPGKSVSPPPITCRWRRPSARA